MGEDVDGNIFLDLNAGMPSPPPVTATRASWKRSNSSLRVAAILRSDFYLPVYTEVCERLDAMAPFGGRPRPVVPDELGHRSGRGGDQALALRRRPSIRDRFYRRSTAAPWGSSHAHREQGEVTDALRPDAPLRVSLLLRDFDYLEDVRLADRLAARGRGDSVETWLGEGCYVQPPDGWSDTSATSLAARDPVWSWTRCSAAWAAAARPGRSSRRRGARLVISGKGIASGLPLGAMIAREDLMVWSWFARIDLRGQSPVVRGRHRDVST